MKFEDAVKIVKDTNALIKAIDEAHNLEPLSDENGIPSFNDYEGYERIAKEYNLDYERFVEHLEWLSSGGLCGKSYGVVDKTVEKKT